MEGYGGEGRSGGHQRPHERPHHHHQHQQHGQHRHHHHHHGQPQQQQHPRSGQQHHHQGGHGEHHHHHQRPRQQSHHPPPPPPHGHHGHQQHQQHQQHAHHHSHHHGHREGVPAKWHSFKMLVDPQIHRGASKMVRYDGAIVPGNPHHVPPTPADPRTYRAISNSSALWRRLEPMELPVPRMKIDENYVGDPPKVEVAIENLNDNVDRHFLHGLVSKLGPAEEMTICYHPVTRKHLGLARIVFEEVRSAGECVRVLDGKSVMGKPLKCYLDPAGASYKSLFLELTEERRPPEPAAPPAAVQDEEKPPSPKDESKRDRDPRSTDSRERRHHQRRGRGDRHSDDHRKARKERGSSDLQEEATSATEDSASELTQPPPPPVGAAAAAANQPPPPPPSTTADSSSYQPSAFDPQYSQPEYWLKQARMYTASAAKSARKSQDSAEEATEESAATKGGDNSPADVPSAASLLLPPPPPVPLAAVDELDLASLAVAGEESVGEDPEADKEVAAVMAVNEDGGESDGEDHKVDLDTRLKMLMKDKSGAMPAFLMDELNASDSEHEEEEEVAKSQVKSEVPYFPQQQQQQQPPTVVFPLQPDEVPLSRPPSPFLSTKVYLQCHTEWVAERRRARELQSVQQALDAGFMQHPHHQFFPKSRKNNGRRPRSRNSDQMSLSSLSSGENNILEQGPDEASAAAAAAYYAAFYPPPLLPGQTEFATPYGSAGQYPPPPHPAMFDPATGMMMPPPPPYDDAGFYHQWWAAADQGEFGQAAQAKQDPRSNIRPLKKESLRVFVEDLKNILHKDITKKMCETFAFYMFEKWWQEQEEKYKAKNRKSHQSTSSERASTSLQSSSKIISAPTPLTSTSASLAEVTNSSNNSTPQKDTVAAASKATEVLTSLFDKQREKLESSGSASKGPGGAFGMGGSLGFGFRGTIPKLPSFKKKKSRPREDRRRDYSSDEDGGRSSNRRTSDKRKEQERRREHRLERERDRRRDSSRDREGSRKEEDRSRLHEDKGKEKQDSKKNSKKTLDSIYSALYSDGSDVGRRSEEAGVAGSDSASSPEIGRKSSKKKKIPGSRSSSEEEEASMSSSGEASSEEEDISSVVSSSKEGKKSSSESASPSSSEVSSSEEEEADENIVASKSKRKRATSRSISPTSRSRSSSSSSSSSSSPSKEEDRDVDVTGTPKTSPVRPSTTEKPEEEQERKKPVPIRKPSLTKAQEADDVAPTPVAAPKVPDIKVPEEVPSHISDHCYAKPISSSLEDSNRKQQQLQVISDHGAYARPGTPEAEEVKPKPASRVGRRTSSAGKKSVLVQQQHVAAARAAKVKTYKQRDAKEQFDLVYRFLTRGLDLEDVNFVKRSYEMMLDAEVKKEESKQLSWLNDTTWVDHPVTEIPDPPQIRAPPRKKARRASPEEDVLDLKRHSTGCARTEGFYKMDRREKMRTKYHLHRDGGVAFAGRSTTAEGSATKGKLQTAQSLSREARSAQRRQLAILGDEVSSHSDLLKFNQLKFRRKQMIFGKSAIHDWGLFAMEDIGADEMVIEYVGHVIRPVLSDVWERAYERQGIGSSYLFRIDLDYVVDATKRGNLARFINHSCDPNCYAKVITVDQQKKIVIYSKQPIAVGEEITYDYKFPIEDEKIHCLCGAKNCRKYLN